MALGAAVASALAAAVLVPIGAAAAQRWPTPQTAVTPATSAEPETLGPAEYRWMRSGRVGAVGAAAAAAAAGLLSLAAHGPAEAAVIVALSAGGALLAPADLRWRLLPLRVLGPMAAVVVAAVAGQLLSGPPRPLLLAAAVQGCYAAAVPLLAWLLGQGGLGDVELAAILGVSLAVGLPAYQWWNPTPAVALTVLTLPFAWTHLGVLWVRHRPVQRFAFGPSLLGSGALTGALLAALTR